MRTDTLLYFALALSLLSSLARAEKMISVEPVVGYEQTQETWPTPHSHAYFFYGARATAGVHLLSAEVEYLHGADDEVLPLQAQSYQNAVDDLKIGARSRLGLGLISLNLRAGLQAQQTKFSQTTLGITTTGSSTAYHPYGGAGLGMSMGPFLYFDAELTAIFVDTQDLKQTQYQLTAGLAVHLP